jgi:hypothetical protein
MRRPEGGGGERQPNQHCAPTFSPMEVTKDILVIARTRPLFFSVTCVRSPREETNQVMRRRLRLPLFRYPCGGASPPLSDLLRHCTQIQSGGKERRVVSGDTSPRLPPDRKSDGIGTFTCLSFPCPSLLRALSYLQPLIFIADMSRGRVRMSRYRRQA